MKKILCLLFLVLPLAGCGSKPVPAWISAGHQQLEIFKNDFLTGRAPLIADLHFKKAVEEIKKSGDLDLMGKAWLTRMALQGAVLEDMDEGEYKKIEAAQSVPANEHFFLFLKGNVAAADGALLPQQYRRFLTALQGAEPPEARNAMLAIDDPLSRLIAAGLVVRLRMENEMILLAAVETASRNGWKRALLAWTKRLQGFYETSGETGKAALIRQRIDLITP